MTIRVVNIKYGLISDFNVLQIYPMLVGMKKVYYGGSSGSDMYNLKSSSMYKLDCIC